MKRSPEARLSKVVELTPCEQQPTLDRIQIHKNESIDMWELRICSVGGVLLNPRMNLQVTIPVSMPLN